MVDRELVLQAAALIDTIEEQHLREDHAYREGYELGYRTGLADGYKKAEDEMGAAWTAVADSVKTRAHQNSHVELEAKRGHDK